MTNLITDTNNSTDKVAANLTEYSQHPLTYRTIARVPEFLAPRLGSWVADDIDETELVDTIRSLEPGQVPSSPAWVARLSEVGDSHFEKAQQLEATGTNAAVKAEYLNAAFYYFLARFPHILGPQARQAYVKHQQAYLAASRYFEPPLEVVRIPFEGKEIIGYLRVPPTQVRPAVVVISGGIDIWKSDSETHTISENLLKQDLATFAVDMPGTGESPVLSSPEAARVFQAVFEYLKTREDIDGNRVGFYGLSFGGHWAVRMALTNPTALRAVVNVGGPIAHTFRADWFSRLPMGSLVGLAVTVGLNLKEAGLAGLGEKLASLSLLENGLLSPKNGGPDLLSINGVKDEQVTIEDLRLISEQGIPQDTLVFVEDRHVASYNRALHLPFAAQWLKTHLA